MIPEDIARVCHEVNRAYCQAIGDHSQVPWNEASPEQRSSCRQGVMAHIENPTMTPEESHESWMQYKLDHGWKWGPEKNEYVKTHPCLVPYLQLPQEQRVKDHLFRAVVHQLRLK